MHPSGVPRGNAGHSPLRETEVVERDDDEDGEREATELSPIRNNGPSSNSNVRPKDTRSWLHRFWRNNVSMSVPHDDCRDHLANERTYLAYLRTSVMLSMVGIIITQLFRIEHVPLPSDRISYHDVGKPLGAAFQVAAMAQSALAFIRYLRQQMSMARGKVLANGWELQVIGVGTLLLTIVTLVLVAGIGTFKQP